MPSSTLVKFLSRLTRAGDRDCSDRELLSRFVHRREDAAFEALVGRHAAMVYGVCRRVLPCEQDAEDAFQATFLVLAQRAASLCWQASVSGWLYEVAHRISAKAQVAATRRRTRERQLECRPPAASAATEAGWREAQVILEEELLQLPERYRAPLLLCCLEGATRDEATRQLGWTLRMLKRRLERGRRLLRTRLARRGLPLATALAGMVVAQDAHAVPAAALGQVTARKVLSFVSKEAAFLEMSARVLLLARDVGQPVIWTKLHLVMVVLLAAGVLAAMAIPWTVPTSETGASNAAAVRPEKADSFDAALAAAAMIDDLEWKARALLAIAEAQTEIGQQAEALRTLDQAFDAAYGMPEDRLDHIVDRCRLLGWIGNARALAGDIQAAEKTAQAIRVPPGTPEPEQTQFRFRQSPAQTTHQTVQSYRATVFQSIAITQAKARKLEQAQELFGRKENQTGQMKTQTVLAILDAQAQAKDWSAARKSALTLEGVDRFVALGTLARRQAEAGQLGEARKTINDALQMARSLRLARGQPNEIEQDRALAKLAIAQADIGDLKEALRIADSCYGALIRDSGGRVVKFPSKERCLTELRARAGDFRGAKQAADSIDERYQDDGYVKGDALRFVARAQAQAREFKAALETTEAIKHAFCKAGAYIDIAYAQAKAQDQRGAKDTIALALHVAQELPESKYKHFLFDPAQPELLRALARVQAEIGETQAAQGWIGKIGSSYLRAWALAGLAEGAAKAKDLKDSKK